MSKFDTFNYKKLHSKQSHNQVKSTPQRLERLIWTKVRYYSIFIIYSRIKY